MRPLKKKNRLAALPLASYPLPGVTGCRQDPNLGNDIAFRRGSAFFVRRFEDDDRLTCDENKAGKEGIARCWLASFADPSAEASDTSETWHPQPP